MPPFGGRMFLVDKSALVKTDHAAVSADWSEALRNRQIAVVPITRFEVLYSARSGQDYDDTQDELDALQQVAQTPAVLHAAEYALRELAWRADRMHRVPLQDAIIAAAAQEAAMGVLHYDGHFDRLAKVLAFDNQWIAPAGTL